MGNFTKAHSKWWEDNARETEKNDSKRKKAIMQGQSANTSNGSSLSDRVRVGDDRETVKVRGTPSASTPRQEVTFVDLDEKPTPKPLSDRVRVGDGKKTVKVRR